MDREELEEIAKELKGKRIAAIDYGRKRVGFAVTDEMHISVTPKKFFLRENGNFLEEISNEIEKENAAAVVVGVPYRSDETKTQLIREIENFMENLRKSTGLRIIPFDESFSSRRAVDTMVEIGKKKKFRREKSNTDMIAAAVILRDFLDQTEYL